MVTTLPDASLVSACEIANRRQGPLWLSSPRLNEPRGNSVRSGVAGSLVAAAWQGGAPHGRPELVLSPAPEGNAPEEPFPSRASLVGQLLEQIESGALRWLVLAGELGIGKTFAAEHLIERARERGRRTLRVHCVDGAPPFWLWQQLLARHPSGSELSAAGSASSEPSRDDSPLSYAARRFRVLERALDQLETLYGRNDVILVEDVERADSPSLELLTFVVRCSRGPVLIATLGSGPAAETPEVQGLLAQLAQVAGAERIDLEPLGREEVASQLPGPPRREAADALHARTGGNPLLLRELVRWRAVQTDAPALGSGTSASSVDGLPPALRTLLRQRYAHLSGWAAAVVRAAAVVGHPIDAARLAAVMSCPHAKLLAALDEGSRATVLRRRDDSPGTWSFSHGLLREVIYQELGDGERTELHLRVASEIERGLDDRDGPQRVELAHHLLASLPRGDPGHVVESVRRAARWAARHAAAREAARLYGRALELAERAGVGTPADHVELLIARGHAEHASGDTEATRLTFEEALARSRELGRSDLFVRAALGHGSTTVWGRRPRHGQERLLLEALDRVGEASITRARILARLVGLRGYTELTQSVVDMARESVALAERADPGDVVTDRETTRALHFALQGPTHLPERAATARRLLELERIHGPSETSFAIREVLAGERLMCGDRAEHDALLSEARVSDQVNHPAFRWLLEAARASVAVLEGRLDEAEERVQRVVLHGAEARSPQARLAAVGQIFAIRRAQGRLAEIRPVLESSTREVDWAGGYPLALRASMHVELGELERARAVFEPLIRSWLERPCRHVDWLITAAELSLTCVALGDVQRGRELARLLEPCSELHAVYPGPSFYAGPISFHLGMIARLDGRRDDAVRYLEAAFQACLSVGASVLRRRVERELEAVTSTRSAVPDGGGPAPCGLWRDEHGFTLRFGGRQARARPLLGLTYIATLLTQPHRSLSALELVRGNAVGPRVSRPAQCDALPGEGDAGTLLDAEARRAYRARLRELSSEIEAAERDGDLGLQGRLQRERELLASELTRAFGLSGRPRRAGSPGERARVSVTRAIRKAIAHVETAHPPLAAHLRATIRTGRECSYVPRGDESVVWSA